MAARAKYSYRGRTHTRASKRPGTKRVTVKAHCRRPPMLSWEHAKQKAKEWGF